MDTRKVAAEFRLSHWAQIMQEQKESGLGVKAFSEKAGFHENTYYYWQRKLRKMACEEISRIQHGEATSLVPAKFVEVTPREEPKIPTLIIPQQSQISIETSRMCIKADSEYPLDKLLKLLREATRSC